MSGVRTHPQKIQLFRSGLIETIRPDGPKKHDQWGLSMIAFIIWSIVALVIIGIGIYSFVSKKPVGFFSGIEPPKVKDTKKYNRAVALLWFIYGTAFELLALPFLFAGGSALIAITVIGGTIALSIALPIVYSLVILKKYQE